MNQLQNGDFILVEWPNPNEVGACSAAVKVSRAGVVTSHEWIPSRLFRKLDGAEVSLEAAVDEALKISPCSFEGMRRFEPIIGDALKEYYATSFDAVCA